MGIENRRCLVLLAIEGSISAQDVSAIMGIALERERAFLAV